MLLPAGQHTNGFPDGPVAEGGFDVASEPSSLTDELRQYLRTEVTRQRCKAERVARQKLLNRRTLSRRLRVEGTSIRQLVNEAQFEIAKQLLAETTMAMRQISAALAFSEPAAFTHAFRRWSGMTPSAWRKATRVETRHDKARSDRQLARVAVVDARCKLSTKR